MKRSYFVYEVKLFVNFVNVPSRRDYYEHARSQCNVFEKCLCFKCKTVIIHIIIILLVVIFDVFNYSNISILAYTKASSVFLPMKTISLVSTSLSKRRQLNCWRFFFSTDSYRPHKPDTIFRKKRRRIHVIYWKKTPSCLSFLAAWKNSHKRNTTLWQFFSTDSYRPYKPNSIFRRKK